MKRDMVSSSPGLVQPEVGGDDCRQVDLDGFQAAVDLTQNLQLRVFLLDLGRESALRRKKRRHGRLIFMATAFSILDT